jgi:hypothetical protein
MVGAAAYLSTVRGEALMMDGIVTEPVGFSTGVLQGQRWRLTHPPSLSQERPRHHGMPLLLIALLPIVAMAINVEVLIRHPC